MCLHLCSHTTDCGLGGILSDFSGALKLSGSIQKKTRENFRAISSIRTLKWTGFPNTEARSSHSLHVLTNVASLPPFSSVSSSSSSSFRAHHPAPSSVGWEKKGRGGSTL